MASLTYIKSNFLCWEPMYQIYVKETLYHPRVPLISMMMPLVTQTLSVTLSSNDKIWGWLTSGMNLRWIGTSPRATLNHPLLQSVLAGTDNLSTGCDFHFSQAKLVIPKGLHCRIISTSQWFPLATYPHRLSSCFITPPSMEEFLNPFTLGPSSIQMLQALPGNTER